MLLVGYGRETSTEYDPCWPGKGFSNSSEMYLMLVVILPRLNCIRRLRQGYLGGPPPIGNPSAIINP